MNRPKYEDALDDAEPFFEEDDRAEFDRNLEQAGIDPHTPVDTFLRMQGRSAFVTMEDADV